MLGAFASNPNYLFLDEPTSAMDPKSEKLFVENMKNYANDKTLIVVTHRRPILALTNRLILIEHGNILMDGQRMLFLKNLLNSFPKLSLFNLLISVFCAVLAWSMLFKLDKSTNVSGVVEPKGNVISLQNRFDGKIKSVEVSAGDRVKKGDILFVLDPEQDAGGLKEKILEAKNLQTQKRRHIAQLNQSTDFKKSGRR